MEVTPVCTSVPYRSGIGNRLEVVFRRFSKLQKPTIFVILDFKLFCRVLNVVCFLLGDSPVSEFYMPTFRNTLFHLHRQVGACTYLPMKMEQTECSETSAYKIQTPGNHPKESIQHIFMSVRPYVSPNEQLGSHRRDIH